ncbi:MAG: molybdenum cofactor biosynthesis protein MoaE, partial [Candidatus Thalassarchaeaceae archaeon]|nr:molybdenum cofactor biosynthesis protein MoaE [Candidatus Thalassarchaeaceae archaeon]
MSKEEVIIRIEEDQLDPNFLRSLLNIEGCGSVVSFVGLTRGDDNGIKVKRLEFDAWENKLNHILSDIAKTSIDK